MVLDRRPKYWKADTLQNGYHPSEPIVRSVSTLRGRFWGGNFRTAVEPDTIVQFVGRSPARAVSPGYPLRVVPLNETQRQAVQKIVVPAVQSAASTETCRRSSRALFTDHLEISYSNMPCFVHHCLFVLSTGLRQASRPRSSVTMDAAMAWAARALGCRSQGRRHDESMSTNR